MFKDAYWVDEVMLDLPLYFGRRVAWLPTLVVATLHDDEFWCDHRVRSVVGHLAAAAGAPRIHARQLKERGRGHLSHRWSGRRW